LSQTDDTNEVPFLPSKTVSGQRNDEIQSMIPLGDVMNGIHPQQSLQNHPSI